MAPEVVLLTTYEVARLFRVDESTIRRWTYKGKLRAVQLPGQTAGERAPNLRFRRDYIEAILRGEDESASDNAS